MPGDFGVVYCLWDFAADEGRLLDAAAGEVGLDHVTVPAVTGAQTQFRLGLGGETPHFHTEGGWHFRPGAKAYAGCALRPSKARWAAGGDLLAQLRERAGRLGLKLVIRVDVRAVRALVDQERHLSQRNAWGQEVPFSGGCASNSELRELLRATLEDLQRYDPAAYEVVDWAPNSPVDRATSRPLDWHPAVRRLLDLCFCASCRQVVERTEVDPDQAARSTRVQVEQLLVQPPAHRDALPQEDPVVASYCAAQAADCCQWLQRLSENAPQRRWYLLRAFGEPPLGNIAPWVRLLRLPAGACGPLAGDEWSRRVQAFPEISALALPVWRPTFSEATELVWLASEAVRAGVGLFDFEGLAESGPEAVTWLRQAVRKARRG